MKLPITKPYFTEREFELIQNPLKTGWVVQGKYVEEFENNIAEYSGAKYGIAINSCTSGQFLMSQIIGLQPGDEVIVPAFTWISTANSAEFYGAKAVFCDIDIHTFNIDVTQIEEKITSKTKAIFPVSLFGLPANMPEIMAIAQKHNLKVVEDIACGLGGFIDKQHVGTFDMGGILSFHPRKSITTGEGGMIITNDENVAVQARSIRDHGALRTDYERHHDKGSFLLTEYAQMGFNMRMTDIQGALGVAQSEKIPFIFENKQRIARIFNDKLSAISFLKSPFIPENYTSGYQAYVCLFKPEETLKAIEQKDENKILALNKERNDWMAKLENKGISTRQGTHAVHLQKLYREKYNYKESDFFNAFAADKLTVALPFYPQMTDDEIEFLFENLKID